MIIAATRLYFCSSNTAAFAAPVDGLDYLALGCVGALLPQRLSRADDSYVLITSQRSEGAVNAAQAVFARWRCTVRLVGSVGEDNRRSHLVFIDQSGEYRCNRGHPLTGTSALIQYSKD